MSITSEEAVQLGQYSAVDASDKAGELVAFIERAEALDPIIELRRRSYEALAVGAGRRVIDVGCGAGGSVAEMAALGADVIGVDLSESMIALAKKRFPHLDYRVAGAEELPIADGSVDGYRAERVYQHLKDPEPAIDEARRVLKPGGRIALIDIDADAWAVNASDRQVTRALLRAFADTLTDPWMGRRMRGLLLGAGFTDVSIISFPCVYTNYDDCVNVLESITHAGVTQRVVTQDEADAWLAEQRQLASSGGFLVHGPLLMAAGLR